ncbi:uncharacterized protein [Rutidosis leptorrhynchoides]|uniref:uncharacterized protein n=1 Tax=Rutidosis leptorrhynchoides TaxID=125765 RepID=UPI003A99DD1A
MTSGYNFTDLVSKAQFRWLNPEEVVFILQNFEEKQLSPEPTQKPPNGSLFLFNRRVIRFFRKDGHNWRRKKDGRSVGEAHERLKVGKIEALICYYAHGDPDPNFQRRCYWMLDPAVDHIVLVHYRDISKRYGEFAQLEIQLEEILSATNNFVDENLITEGRLGKYYKGKFLQSGHLIDIAAQRLSNKHGQVDVEFWNEISVLSSLKHKNIISIIGFCDDKDEKIIVYDLAVNGNLNQHLSYPTLTWLQRLQICLSVARALSYIHYDIIHCNINSSNIFLDKDWEPKISGFELSTKYPQSWRHRLLFSRYFETKSMTPKYDVYSFGLLLFDVLCGRKPMVKNDGTREELDEIIDPDLRKQMDLQSLNVFSRTAYNCFNQQLLQRPTMDQVVKELEDALEHQWKHENLEHPTTAYEAPSSNNLKMEWLKIPLRKIREATNNFDDSYSIGFGGFGMVYKAQLEVLDVQSLSLIEGIRKDALPKRSQTVAIKRIFSRPDEQGKQGFFTEIELLTSCKHPNIVTLLGFSRENREMILVYEYAFKGSLDDYLGNNSNTINLTWVQRLQICLDVAHGIDYLHTNMDGKPRIIHRDIKSENILLDENLKAKAQRCIWIQNISPH